MERGEVKGLRDRHFEMPVDWKMNAKVGTNPLDVITNSNPFPKPIDLILFRRRMWNRKFLPMAWKMKSHKAQKLTWHVFSTFVLSFVPSNSTYSMRGMCKHLAALKRFSYSNSLSMTEQR